MEDDEERELKITEWNYKHAQDHFKGMIEGLDLSDMSKFLSSLEEVAAALDIEVNIDKIQDEIYAL